MLIWTNVKLGWPRRYSKPYGKTTENNRLLNNKPFNKSKKKTTKTYQLPPRQVANGWMRKKAQLFCHCLLSRTSLTEVLSQLLPALSGLVSFTHFNLNSGHIESRAARIGRMTYQQDIKFVCMIKTLIGWTGLLNSRRERSFVCSESKYVHLLMCGGWYV